MADAADSKSAGSDTLWVQVPSPVFLVYPVLDRLFLLAFFHFYLPALFLSSMVGLRFLIAPISHVVYIYP